MSRASEVSINTSLSSVILCKRASSSHTLLDVPSEVVRITRNPHLIGGRQTLVLPESKSYLIPSIQASSTSSSRSYSACSCISVAIRQSSTFNISAQQAGRPVVRRPDQTICRHSRRGRRRALALATKISTATYSRSDVGEILESAGPTFQETSAWTSKIARSCPIRLKDHQPLCWRSLPTQTTKSATGA